MVWQRRVVVLSDDIVCRSGDVEVQAPLDVVVVGVADTGVVHRAEAEPRTDRPVRVQMPSADVAVPASL
jgi:hypothetical protein